MKVEGLAQRDDCQRIVAAARCNGRGTVGCIVLGRGADATQVRHWLATAAGVPGFIGFAVGRTTFWDAVVGWQAQTTTRAEAVEQIAARFLEWGRCLRDGAPRQCHRPGGSHAMKAY